ncbi:MAG: NAD(P)/FAD-dependent oxidoreductase [Opitutales bacterium]|jgi:protoporphyrinogen oxidase
MADQEHNAEVGDGKRICMIVGAGPAGLTAALELLREGGGIKPIVFEAGTQVGGISRTVVYKGNRIDIGGHRFFSKSEWVTNWWNGIMDMPERSRLSRIYYLRRFFSYPISLSVGTLRNLGLRRTIRVGLSYIGARMRQIKPERSLADFMINRFGRELYNTFFRDYTHKVWGQPCEKISPEWGAQRIKGVSVSEVLLHALRSMLRIRSKHQETSLIDSFLYPPLGPGQLWERVAEMVRELGGEIHLNTRAEGVRKLPEGGWAVTLRGADGASFERSGRWLISTMPVRELVASLSGVIVPEDVREVAAGLVYRDFITVGLLAPRFAQPALKASGGELKDNWIYIQESDVKVGRVQVFPNWSRDMVAKPGLVWIGLEYFCSEGDELDRLSDTELKALGAAEMERIGFINAGEVMDSCVIRQPKAYPAYFGSYDRFDVVRAFLDSLPGLIPVGRNGMHRYNNADHSMLAARAAVDLILSGMDAVPEARAELWDVNAEKEYHEAGSRPARP